MKSQFPDEEDSLIDGDALSDEGNEDEPSLPKESLIDDSPFNEDADEGNKGTTQSIPPPED